MLSAASCEMANLRWSSLRLGTLASFSSRVLCLNLESPFCLDPGGEPVLSEAKGSNSDERTSDTAVS